MQRRRKEALIEAQKDARSRPYEPWCWKEMVGSLDALLRGQGKDALWHTALLAGGLWKWNALASFDLRKVDEQGYLIEEGMLFVGGPNEERRTWKAGDHLDEVLRAATSSVIERSHMLLLRTTGAPPRGDSSPSDDRLHLKFSYGPMPEPYRDIRHHKGIQR